MQTMLHEEEPKPSIPNLIPYLPAVGMKTQKIVTRNNINPVKKFVNEYYNHRSGISGLASDLNVGYQTIHKTVLGLHSHIPPRLVKHMGDVSGISEEVWQEEYAAWINKELDILLLDIRAGKIEASAFFVPASRIPEQYADFTEWRSSLSYSQIDFCKTFLLHQAIMNRYESGLMKNLPESLVDRIKFILNGLFDIDKDSVAAYVKAVQDLPIKKRS